MIPRYNVPDLTPKEMESISSFRRLVEDLWDEDKEVQVGSRESRKHMDDGTLLRFVQSRPTIEAAADMYRESMTWREQVRIDEIHDKHYPISNRGKAAQVAGQTFYGTILSPPGHPPIMFDRMGALDMSGIASEEGMADAICECYTAYLEETFRLARAFPGGRGRALVVVDLKGLSMSHVSNIGLIKRIAAIGPPRYPETTGCVAIVRGPWILSAIWKVISPILPANTRAKIKIMGKNFLAELADGMMPADQIPTFLGGTCWVGENDPTNIASTILEKSSKVIPGCYARAQAEDAANLVCTPSSAPAPAPPPGSEDYVIEPTDIADVGMNEVPDGNIHFRGHRNSIAVAKELAQSPAPTPTANQK